MEVLCSSSRSIYSPCVLSYPASPPRNFHSNCNPISSNSSSYGLSVSKFCNSGFSPLNSSSRRRGKRKLIISAAFERFTERAIKAVVLSQREVRSLGKDMVFTQHLLLGLIAEDRDPDGFLGSGIKIEKAREVVRSIWHGDHDAGEDSSSESAKQEGSIASSTDVPFSLSTKRVFEVAVEYSRTMGYNFIAPEHIAIGLFSMDDGSAVRVLHRLGANVEDLITLAIARLHGELENDGTEPKKMPEKSSSRTTSGFTSPEATKEKSALAQFCVDLTARASEGRIDPVIGRETEVQRVIEILGRKTKNNPILLGEAGVGKTAIAEGVAISIAQADAPFFLLGKRVMTLDIGLLIAGAKERGELESRVTRLISETINSGDVILFIDEVHTLIGSGTVGKGNKGSGLDIGNLLKPALGRGELQCIAATTIGEYRTHFEKDAALARRFQPVMVNEPTQEDAVKILLGLRKKYEAHHKCRYTLEAINEAVYLSARYIPDRHLPDKAIDLLDEAGSRARMEAFKKRIEEESCVLSNPADEYWQEIKAVQAMHEVVKSSKLKQDNRLTNTDEERNAESSLPSTPEYEEPMVVGRDDIAAVASIWSGIPVQQLTADERTVLIGLDEELKKRVIGQDRAVDAISRAVKRSRVGLKDPDRPIAAMIFCGPTGVGKTEITKALAASYFGSEDAMLRLDMSEYMERHTVSKLIGSPPGYIGFEEGGMLTEAIRKRPFTVLLLDEIEKAHPDIFNILLQLFEDGHLKDSQGRRVSFKNALIVMTSNIGFGATSRGNEETRFLFDDEDVGFDDEETPYDRMKSRVTEELKAFFRPELLNRIDELVVFQPLEKKQIFEIMNIMLNEVKKRLISLGIGLKVTKAMKKLIAKQGYDPKYGARPLRRAVTALLEDPLSEKLLSGEYLPGETLIMDVDASGNPVVKRESARKVNVSGKSSIV